MKEVAFRQVSIKGKISVLKNEGISETNGVA